MTVQVSVDLFILSVLLTFLTRKLPQFYFDTLTIIDSVSLQFDQIKVKKRIYIFIVTYKSSWIKLTDCSIRWKFFVN